MTVLIQLTTAGSDTGPFNLYSDVDSFGVPFEVGVTKVDLLAGYLSSLVPDLATTIRVCSTSLYCSNCVDISVEPIPCENGCGCYEISTSIGSQVDYTSCLGIKEDFIYTEPVKICAAIASVTFPLSEGTATLTGCCDCVELPCICPTTTTTSTTVSD
jgi:hypothetical protein